MKEIEELILLELKKQLNESPDGDDDYEATLQRALSDQSMTNQNPRSAEQQYQDGGSDQWTGSNPNQGNNQPTNTQPNQQTQNDQQQSNQNQEPEALKLYQHRSQKHLDSINNYIIGYNRFLTKIEKRRKQINQNSSPQQNEQTVQEDNGDNTQQDLIINNPKTQSQKQKNFGKCC